MPAGQHDIVIEKGANYNLNLQVLQDDGSTPVNLTGYTVQAMVRILVDDANPVIDFAGHITITALTGSITLYQSAAETAALTFANGVYDIILTSSGGTKQRLLQGRVTVNKSVTR